MGQYIDGDEMNSAAPQKKARDIASESHAQAAMEALQKLRVLVRAAQRHSTWIEKQCGVSGAQLWIMQELKEAPGLRVGQVAERLAIHQTTASNLLDALSKKGLISKARDPKDQRVVTLQLSHKGRTVLAKAPTPARGLLPEGLRRLNQKELKELNKRLQALLDVVDRVDDNAGLQPLPFTM
jgi:DNA-binding MarR family transcriptional regulator